MEGNTTTTAHRLADRIARTAWFAAFVVPLILAALLLGVRSAQATPPVAGPAPLSVEELAFEEELEAEEDEAEFAEEECEIAKEEATEGELSKAEADEVCSQSSGSKTQKAGPSSAAPEECVLRSAHGHAGVEGQGTKLKLTIGYTAYEPVGAKIEIGKGSSHIATLHQNLGRSGVVRIVKSLHGDDVPKRLTVGIELPSSESVGCPFRRLVLFPR
ncbi:MAG TPA: hypothetical protein VIM28_02900 [Solirubrobacterales bacterium]